MKDQTDRFGKKRELGQSMAEVALALPIFLILIAGIVEVSNLLVAQNRIDTAARAATRWAAAGGQKPHEIALTSVRDTISDTVDIWDIWVIKATFDEQSGTLTNWTADLPLSEDGNPNTQAYGIGQTEIYSDVLALIGDDCVSDPPTVDLNDPEANYCLRDRTLATLYKERPSDPANRINNLEIVGTFISHDIETILGLDIAFPNAEFLTEDILAAQAYSFMRTTTIVGDTARGGCPTVFPIVMDRGNRALTRDQLLALNNLIEYPASDINPGSFFMSPSETAVPLDDASERYLFWISAANNNFSWLQWNRFIVSGSQTLANSLDYPGDVSNYSDNGDAGTPLSPPGHVVRGFVELGNSLDRAINVGDQTMINRAVDITDANVQAILQEHIDRKRTLRIALYGSGEPIKQFSDPSIWYHVIDGFVVVRPIAYTTQNGGGILLEFITLDSSCGLSETVP